MGTLECVIFVCLGVCTCVCVLVGREGGGGQAGRIPARSVFQTPEKLSEAAVADDDRLRRMGRLLFLRPCSGS